MLVNVIVPAVIATDPGGPAMIAAAYESCPVTSVLRRIGGEWWSRADIRLLAAHPPGFDELDRSIDGIGRRVLTRTPVAWRRPVRLSCRLRSSAGPGRVRADRRGHSQRE